MKLSVALANIADNIGDELSLPADHDKAAPLLKAFDELCVQLTRFPDIDNQYTVKP